MVACIDHHVAAQFVMGLLSGEQAHRVQCHVEQCEECRSLLTAAGTATLDDIATAGILAADDTATTQGIPAADSVATLTLEQQKPTPGSQPAARQRVGSVLAGTYVVVRFIGSGGMGMVYEVSHTRLPLRLALKLLAQPLHASPEAVTRLRREAEVTSRLAHPNIVHVVDFNTTEEGIPFIVMELLEGEPLSSRLRREGVIHSVDELASIVRQATAGMGAAHQSGVVHRDLKPTNIFLCKADGLPLVKVMDFGISKILDATIDLTQDMTVLGSPNYMSPQQAQGKSSDVDWRADVFAMGAIIYRMLAGAAPFKGPSVPATLYRVVHEDPTPTESWDRVPGPLQDVVLQALNKKPLDRQSSMEQLWSEFAEALRSIGCKDFGTPRAQESAASRLRKLMPHGRRALWLAVAVLLLGSGLIASYLATRGGRER